MEEYVVYIYNDESGDKLIDALVFDNEDDAFDFADTMVDKYQKVEVFLKIKNEDKDYYEKIY